MLIANKLLWWLYFMRFIWTQEASRLTDDKLVYDPVKVEARRLPFDVKGMTEARLVGMHFEEEIPGRRP